GEKLRVAPKGTLSLKRPGVEQGVVKQSFSHGRTKSVVVEKVKRRLPGEPKPEAAPAAQAAPAAGAASGRRPAARGATAAPAQPAPAAKPAGGVVLRTLTEEERSARASALESAKVREAEERRIAEEEQRRRSERDSRERVEREAAEARKREEEERRRHDDETKRKAEQEAKRRFRDAETKKTAGVPISLRNAVAEPEDDELPRPRRGGGAGAPARPAAAPRPARGGAQKNRGRLTVVTALDAGEVRERSVASFRRRVQRHNGQVNHEPN